MIRGAVERLAVPPCHELTRRKSLSVGSDDTEAGAEKGVKRWLRAKAAMLNYSTTALNR